MEANPSISFIEGKAAGEGTIKLVLKKPGGTVENSGEVHVKLQSVPEMYERVHGEPKDGFEAPYLTGGLAPTPTFQWDNPGFEKPAGEQSQCIVFVHGVNMFDFDYVSFSETMFKRLWHVGYRGRFASFRWPSDLTGSDIGNNLNYNTGEYHAWKYGTALKAYVGSLQERLPGYSMNMAAHSMGNIVAGAALKRGMAIDNYVLLQAAVSASCYDENEELFFGHFMNAEKRRPTPDLAQEFGYRGYFRNIAGNLVNFYNPQDYALSSGKIGAKSVSWDSNNFLKKPDTLFGFTRMGYWYDGAARFRGEKKKEDRLLTDPHEAMAYVARSRTKAAGAEGRTGGAIGGSVNLQDPVYDFGQTRQEHSAEFNRNIQQNMKAFYGQLLRSFNLDPNP